MTVVAVTPPPTELVSPELWRTWFDRGLLAIETGEYASAKRWLTEAMRHVTSGGTPDRQAMALATQAFACLREAQTLCRQALSPCIGKCESESMESFARKDMIQARENAQIAAPRLSSGTVDPQALLARARAVHVLAEGCRLADDFAAALPCFTDAKKLYSKNASQIESLEEVNSRLFEVNFQLGIFEAALLVLSDLETLVASQPDKKTFAWLARLASARANTLLELGRYRDAGSLYDRWSTLITQETQNSQDPYDRSAEFVTFARTQLILGNFEVAAKLIERSERLLCCLPMHKDWLRACLTTRYCCCPCRDDLIYFDITLLKAEHSFAVGDFKCAGQLIDAAASKNPIWNDRQIRLTLLKGRFFNALGRFKEACECFSLAKQLSESMSPCRRPFFVSALRGLARTEGETSSWSAAIGHACRAINCLEDHQETVTAEFALSLHELAIAYIRDDRGSEAFPLCDKARTLVEMVLRPGHPVQAPIELTMAEAWIDRRQPARAIESCSKARQLYRQFHCRDGFAFARSLRIEAEAHQYERQTECAFQLLHCALKCWEDEEGCLGRVHPEKALIILDLAINDVAVCEGNAAEAVIFSVRELLCQLKGSLARAAFELNRRGNLFLKFSLFNEADWLYCHAEEFYRECYGATHPFTIQVCENREVVKQRRKAACPPVWIDHR